VFAPFFVAAVHVVLSAPPDTGPAPAELVTKLAKGEVNLAALIEPRRGLIWIDHFEGPADERPVKVAKHLCGLELGGEWAALETRLVDDAKRTLEARDGQVLCATGKRSAPLANAFGGTTCTVGATMEWDPAVHLVFERFPSTRAWPEHHALVAVYIDDDVLVDEATIRVQHTKLTKAAKALVKRACR
jgi:hypothetical protein